MSEQSKRKALKIFHGPHNIGGIGRFLADWQRKQGLLSDFVVYRDITPQNNSHLNLHLEKYPPLAKIFINLAFFFLCLFKYDLFQFYFGQTLLPFSLDLPILKLFGKKMIMVYAGSDVRLQSVEKTRNPYHQFFCIGANDAKNDGAKRRRMAWQGFWVDRVIAVRNLYANVATSVSKQKIVSDIWAVNTFELDQYQPVYETNPTPVIVHAPTNPRLKGSDYIEQAVASLQEKGCRFEYVRLEKIPYSETQQILQRADIIVDQLFLGGFGNLSMEGMAYGKPVCCYIIDELSQQYPDLPIVNSNKDNLVEKLAWLLEHPEERVRLGRAGRVFAEKHYDRNQTSRRLLDLYWKLYD